MGQEQAKATMSEPSFAETSTDGQDSMRIQNRNLIEENNYLRNVNNSLRDQDGAGKTMFAEPGIGKPQQAEDEPIGEEMVAHDCTIL